MPPVDGLRSPYERVGPLVYFGRMIDKIRLQAAGRLPEAYHANLGFGRTTQFDARCCQFFGFDYEALRTRVLEQGGSDEEILAWALAHGKPRTPEEIEIWNRFMMKIGWRDNRSDALQARVREYGLAGKGVETFFDLLDVDEGRDPAATQPWRS